MRRITHTEPFLESAFNGDRIVNSSLAVSLYSMEKACEGLFYTMPADGLWWDISPCCKASYAQCGGAITDNTELEACILWAKKSEISSQVIMNCADEGCGARKKKLLTCSFDCLSITWLWAIPGYVQLHSETKGWKKHSISKMPWPRVLGFVIGPACMKASLKILQNIAHLRMSAVTLW